VRGAIWIGLRFQQPSGQNQTLGPKNMHITGHMPGRGTDAQWLIPAGLLAMTAGNYWMSQMTLDISPGDVVWPRVVVVAGLAACFAPANVAA
jgi:MFS transporter, DHA2 family, multidrug resistance protein